MTPTAARAIQSPLSVLSLALLFLCACTSSRDHGAPVALDPDLTNELAKMVAADQAAIRTANSARGETARKDADARKALLLDDQTARVREIFLAVGYPGFDRVGEAGSADFWLLVQHSDRDPEFQQQVLHAMRIEVNRGNVNPENFAFLRDRTCKNAGKLQLYGTQVDYTSAGQARPLPLEDPAGVNARRSKLGLEPIEEYLNGVTDMHFEINQKFFSENGVQKPTPYERGHSTRRPFETP